MGEEPPARTWAIREAGQLADEARDGLESAGFPVPDETTLRSTSFIFSQVSALMTLPRISGPKDL